MMNYLDNKDTTVIGNGTSDHVDINISGTGISSIHAILNIDDINEKIFLTVKSNARTFVNSQNVLKETELFNGDHILFGYRHVFRLHTPYANGKNILENIETNEYESVIKEATIGNSPLKRRESFTRMIENMEVKHLADKSDALMQQKECFEDQMEKMRNLLKSKDLQSQLALNKISSDEFTTTLSSNEDVYTRTSTDLNSYFDKTKYEEPQYDNREKQLNRLFNYLKETVYIAETLSEECNAIMREYDIDCVCYPTLTIPPENLCANRSQNILISDGAIEVVYKFLVRIYTIDNFENKFLILRDVYNENKLISNDLQSEMNELVIEIFELNTSQFLGMGNMYLVALLYDLPFMYHVPVINEEGEIIGKIEIGIGRRIVDNIDSCFYEDSSTEMEDGIENKLHNGMSVEISISISEIFDVIPHKHNYLSIKYQFWDIKSDEFIEALPNKTGSKFYINNNQKFQISVTDEFLEYLSECAMSIAVYGKNSADNTKIDSNCNINAGLIEDKLKVLNEQWVEISKKMDVKMEIFEITSNNIYEHVEMEYDKCIESGGLFNLNLGASQHIKITVNVAEDDKSSLPLIINDIETAMIGSICIKNVNETQLDSYQDIDLKIIHQKWTDALDHKREILESDLDLLSKLEDKTKMQNLEESKLVEQWVSLTSEKQAVLSPIDGSCIPGAKLSLKNVKQGCEKRMPVLFMDLTDKLSLRFVSDQQIFLKGFSLHPTYFKTSHFEDLGI
ncbi:hypothetical protein A3Q56_00959 [Intoshia linei]|uniref:FHA domain-containing protein n=1 Tax=Intoshia linei TaxID=1819745 RepID=A0A177BCL3_9BILA|nr:hypothetical protein A3Q56_00959 [Intoshia linei]